MKTNSVDEKSLIILYDVYKLNFEYWKIYAYRKINRKFCTCAGYSIECEIKKEKKGKFLGDVDFDVALFK